MGSSENGAKNIAAHFNTAGILVRGAKWSRNRVHRTLTETAYRGEYAFNQFDVRANTMKPRDEWVIMQVPAIVPTDVFEAVAELRRAQPAASRAESAEPYVVARGFRGAAKNGA